MNKKNFYILNGNNGSSYGININNWMSTSNSLGFYKARTPKQKILKIALQLSLYLRGKFCGLIWWKSLYDKYELASYLKNLVAEDVDFMLDDDSSVLVSPTRDKIIVHHHNQYFHKFAFGGSYKKVKNEVKIYELLNKPLNNFIVSIFFDFSDYKSGYCSFKLSSNHKKLPINNDLVSALVEMFNTSRNNTRSLPVYINSLQQKYEESGVCNNLEQTTLTFLKDANIDDVIIPLGLVHRDFKPWNIKLDGGLLIYDFEEAVKDGPPLEDLLNYIIDPLIRYVTPQEMTIIILDEGNIQNYNRYLQAIDTHIDFQTLLYCYLIERAIFWSNANEIETSKKYCNLFEYIVKELQTNA